ncbi:mechanosensitive ion channel family protein [Halarcobacter ebronensis]|uniref:Mechanosensitive ion channel protein MscS n=1 Tax=Halarcobacter ebronensis TaxID=1462615 RepID=A0A4Q1AG87_9BACT|nr:mechanosensitive ion channel family protein [Halarcobacter ebronensis]QKF81821.1 mechanosensitive ion channel family protein [Halarcobacter ebronensis]RXK01579.1 mechanosensitive ion channel protein MscS [Halarcobacter ebronensis]
MEQELQTIQKFYNIIIEFFVNYSFQLIGAIIIFVIGWFLANKISNAVRKLCEKNELDVTLTKFVVNIVKFGLIIGITIIALGKIGITLTPFIAGIGAASLGAGLALQGTLSNYGAGLSIIIGRPFIVGNTITVEGISGVVEEIRLANTILSTEDGEIITIPNKHIIGEVIVNSFEYKVVESVVGIDYKCDPKKAIEAIRAVLNSFENEVSKELKAQIGIKEFGDFSINIELRYWSLTKSYFETQYRVNLAIYEAFKQNNINIPFPTYNLIKKD